MPRYRNSLNFDPDEKTPSITRRSFLALLGLGAVGGLAHLFMGALGSFLYPNALKVPPSVFSLGRPADVLASEGKLFLPKHKVFVEVANSKVRVQTAVCTHLGCTVNAVETGYACPCHGSTYDLDGYNTGGPAPKPLLFFEVFKGASGDLQVDKARKIGDPLTAWWTATT
jgi:cytochrome b6-f complex iron-sulfur subunit